MELFVLFGSFTFLLLIGTPVAFCLGASSFATIAYIGLPPVAAGLYIILRERAIARQTVTELQAEGGGPGAAV